MTQESDLHWSHLAIMLVASVVALVNSRYKAVQSRYMPSLERDVNIVSFFCFVFWEDHTT